MSPHPNARVRTLLRIASRIALILLIAYLAHLGLSFVESQLKANPTENMRLALNGLVLLALVLYALLIAIPFVPGVEIGLSLLMMRGADVAPLVFIATFAGLTLAFLIGQWLPYPVLIRLFHDLRLGKAAALVERLAPLGRAERLEILREQLPDRLGKIVLRYRYLTVALALNIPGNAFIGGGGGIAMIAGLSRLFSTRIILIWFALAVLPVPLLVMLYGKSAFDLFGF